MRSWPFLFNILERITVRRQFVRLKDRKIVFLDGDLLNGIKIAFRMDMYRLRLNCRSFNYSNVLAKHTRKVGVLSEME